MKCHFFSTYLGGTKLPNYWLYVSSFIIFFQSQTPLHCSPGDSRDGSSYLSIYAFMNQISRVEKVCIIYSFHKISLNLYFTGDFQECDVICTPLGRTLNTSSFPTQFTVLSKMLDSPQNQSFICMSGSQPAKGVSGSGGILMGS